MTLREASLSDVADVGDRSRQGEGTRTPDALCAALASCIVHMADAHALPNTLRRRALLLGARADLRQAHRLATFGLARHSEVLQQLTARLEELEAAFVPDHPATK